MQYFNMLDIRLSQIQQFLAAAELGSVTQAAKVLHLTQSTVSKNIRYLEDTLGLYLFIRDRQALRLTPAGRLLQEEFSTVCDITRNALERAHALQTGGQNPMVIGIPDSANLQKIFLSTKQWLAGRELGGTLHVECLSFHELGTKLLAGAVDIVITCGFDRPSFPESSFLVTEVPAGPYYAYLDRRNALCGRASLRMEDLRASAFFITSPLSSPTYEQLVLGLCRQAGFQPRVARYLASPNAFLCNFDTGDEVFLADEYMRESENPNLVKVPIEGTESSMLFLRRRETGDPMTACIYQEIVDAWRRAAEG